MGDADSRVSLQDDDRRSESMAKIDAQQIARAVFCGLAVTCLVVMYISADGAQEYVQEAVKGHDAGTSVDSTDVLKAGQIYTETPSGRMRLMDYFNGVERRIASELANRRADVASVRAQMARDFAFNAAARSKLKKNMLHKMAVNAKTCRDNLNTAMRRTQDKFAKKARLANRRWFATMKRDRKTISMIKSDSRQASRNLRLSVSTWQRAPSAWAAATNSRINKMNKHVAANSAQIKENAKKAQKDLEKTMRHWDYKVNSFKRSSKKSQSKLRAQFRAQDKAQRAWANNKISALVASTAAEFHRVNVAMAKQRHEIDMAMKHATTRFAASLNAARALEDHRYSKTIADIAAVRKETDRRVGAAKKEFKVGILRLSSVVKQQVQKVTSRIDATAGVVRSNRAAQEVKALARDTVRRIGHLRSRAARNRISMARDLTRATGKLYKRMSKMQSDSISASRKLNRSISASKVATRNALKHAKALFASKVVMLSNTVAANLKRNQADVARVTGVVANIAKANAADRRLIKQQRSAMEADMNKSITRSIQLGEAKAKASAQRIAEYQKGAVKRFLRVELTERLENAADNVFKAVAGKRNKIADNYLSLKAYAISAKDRVIDYRGKKKGSLSSVGDPLATLGALDSVKIRAAPGLGLGGGKAPPLFAGKKIKESKSLSKINGLVNEFTRSVGQVRMRWPLGLGKYLLDKLEESMMTRGVLEVDKIAGKRGNFVFINGRSDGLSNKLNDFSKLSSGMTAYESTLAKLTAQLTKSSKGKKPAGKIVVKPPEWQGK